MEDGLEVLSRLIRQTELTVSLLPKDILLMGYARTLYLDRLDTIQNVIGRWIHLVDSLDLGQILIYMDSTTLKSVHFGEHTKVARNRY